ncbi:location of vulva defective 1 isoform X2 [Halyomorpha halys]
MMASKYTTLQEFGSKVKRSKLDSGVAPDYEPGNSVFSNPAISQIIADHPPKEINLKILKKFKPLVPDYDYIFSQKVPIKHIEQTDEEFDWYQTDDLYDQTISEETKLSEYDVEATKPTTSTLDNIHLSTSEERKTLSENVVEKQIMVLGVQHTPYIEEEKNVTTNNNTNHYFTNQGKTTEAKNINNNNDKEEEKKTQQFTYLPNVMDSETQTSTSLWILNDPDEKYFNDVYEAIENGNTTDNYNVTTGDLWWSELLLRRGMPHTTQIGPVTIKKNWVNWGKPREITDKDLSLQKKILKTTNDFKRRKYKLEENSEEIVDEDYPEEEEPGIWPMWGFFHSIDNERNMALPPVLTSYKKHIITISSLKTELQTESSTFNFTTGSATSSVKKDFPVLQTFPKSTNATEVTSSILLTTHNIMDKGHTTIINGRNAKTSTTPSVIKYYQNLDNLTKNTKVYKNTPLIIYTTKTAPITTTNNFVNWGKPKEVKNLLAEKNILKTTRYLITTERRTIGKKNNIKEPGTPDSTEEIKKTETKNEISTTKNEYLPSENIPEKDVKSIFGSTDSYIKNIWPIWEFIDPHNIGTLPTELSTSENSNFSNNDLLKLRTNNEHKGSNKYEILKSYKIKKSSKRTTIPPTKRKKKNRFVVHSIIRPSKINISTSATRTTKVRATSYKILPSVKTSQSTRTNKLKTSKNSFENITEELHTTRNSKLWPIWSPMSDRTIWPLTYGKSSSQPGAAKNMEDFTETDTYEKSRKLGHSKTKKKKPLPSYQTATTYEIGTVISWESKHETVSKHDQDNEDELVRPLSKVLDPKDLTSTTMTPQQSSESNLEAEGESTNSKTTTDRERTTPEQQLTSTINSTYSSRTTKLDRTSTVTRGTSTVIDVTEIGTDVTDIENDVTEIETDATDIEKDVTDIETDDRN